MNTLVNTALRHSKEYSYIKTQELESADIDSLVDSESGIQAIIIPNFYPTEICEQMSSRLTSHSRLNRYEDAPGILKIGRALFESANDPEQINTYYDQAHDYLKDLRNLFSPFISPMDKLRVSLQENWPAGSNLENFHGKLVNCGLTRLFKEGAEALPHQDMTHWDLKESIVAHSLSTQLAANIYLETAQEGGEIELWSYGYNNQIDYKESMLSSSAYGLDREKIKKPVLTITPKTGDLILFNARNIHAVRKIKKGTRITSSCFIGYRSITQPLSLFS